MYNYQTYLRSEKLQEKCEEIRKSFIKEEHIRTEKKPTYLQAYKKRLDGFLVSVLDRPIEIEEHKSQSYKPRQKDKSKDISHHPFRMNFHTESERTKDTLQANKCLDSIPFTNSSQHKFRQLASSFNSKPLKYSPCCSAIRVHDFFERNRTNQIPYEENKRINKLVRSSKVSMSQKKNQKIVQKSIMPQLNRKMHINSLKTMYSDCPSTLKEKDRSEKQNINDNYIEDFTEPKQEIRPFKKESNHLSHKEALKEAAKDALVKCNMLKLRHSTEQKERF